MEITKIRKREDLKNLTEIAKLFYAEELAARAEEFVYRPNRAEKLHFEWNGITMPYFRVSPDRAIRYISIIADYEHNSVFLKACPGFTNQNLLKEKPELFTKAYPAKDSLIEDITFDVLEKYFKKIIDLSPTTLSSLESSIYHTFRGGQISYLRRHGGAFIESCDEISVTDLKGAANVIFSTYVHDGKLMLNEMQTTFSHEFHILLDWIYGEIFTSDYSYDDDDDVCDLTERFKACVLLENKSDCTPEDIERYILTAARAAMG